MIKIFTISAILLTLLHCDKVKNLSCDERFFDCASVCSYICERTIAHGHEYGKCFTICTHPCREEYCEEIREENQ